MPVSHFYTTMKSPLGEIVLTSSGGGITGLYTPAHPLYAGARKGIRDVKPFQRTIRQLKEYFSGRRKEFDLQLSVEGTPFQKNVWNALRKIPYGETQSYGDVAKSVRNPKASRAVGSVNSKNPICIIVPCHRVIGATGKLTGYAGGIDAKKWLLNHEQTASC